jgi:N,N'-diacetyllegionaminate synthase
MNPKVIRIGDHSIGPNKPCFFIAEAGVNHNGNVETAHRLVEAAARCGADAIKFQTFKAERVVTQSAPKADYQRQTTDRSESQFDMLKKLELDAQAHRALLEHCRDIQLLFLSTPFDEESVDLLDQLGLPAFKTPSGEITNLRYLEHVARKGKPMIVSTGMSYLGEVEAAVQTIEKTGNPDLVLLHAVSNYPAAPSDINLRAMETMMKAFGVPVGYSDHTSGMEVPLAAAALGACVIEKHFTLDRNLPGPDHKASMEPAEVEGLIKGIRMVQQALGNGRKEPAASEMNTALATRKSLVAACFLPAGTVVGEEAISLKRPGTGLPPSFLKYLVGRKTRMDIPADAVLSLDMFL